MLSLFLEGFFKGSPFINVILTTTIDKWGVVE